MKRISKVILAVMVLGAVVCSAQLVQNVKILEGLPPQDINNIVTNTLPVSMKNYGHCTFIIDCGVINNSAAATAQVWEATSVAFTTKQVMNLDSYWVNTAAGAIYTNTTATDDKVPIAGTSDLKTFIVEVDADQMDADDAYDCLRLDISSPGAYSTILGVTTILSEPRFTGNTEAQPSPLAD